jgi:DNA-binding MarR family transcriptional regulator
VADAELAQEGLVIGQRGRDDVRACARGELHGQAADTAGRADDQQHVALGERERVDERQRRDASQRRGACGREVDRAGNERNGGLLGDRDQLSPGAIAHRRVGVEQESEDLIAGLIAPYARSDLVDDACVVAAEDGVRLIVDAHLGEHASSNRAVDRIDRGGLHAHEHLVASRGGLGQVLAQSGLLQSMGVDPSILVTLLNPLEADGLVTRERDPDDRRRHLVTLTAAGKKHLASAARAQKETEKALFASLDGEQREQLRELLLALRDGLADPESAGNAVAATTR